MEPIPPFKQRLKTAVRKVIRQRLGIPELEDRLVKLESQLTDIHAYLRDISSFADYVRGKDEQIDQARELLAQATREDVTKSIEEMEEELSELITLQASVQDSQAVGREEIMAKNRELSRIQEATQTLKLRIGRRTNAGT